MPRLSGQPHPPPPADLGSPARRLQPPRQPKAVAAGLYENLRRVCPGGADEAVGYAIRAPLDSSGAMLTGTPIELTTKIRRSKAQNTLSLFVDIGDSHRTRETFTYCSTLSADNAHDPVQIPWQYAHARSLHRIEHGVSQNNVAERPANAIMAENIDSAAQSELWIGRAAYLVCLAFIDDRRCSGLHGVSNGRRLSVIQTCRCSGRSQGARIFRVQDYRR